MALTSPVSLSQTVAPIPRLTERPPLKSGGRCSLEWSFITSAFVLGGMRAYEADPIDLSQPAPGQNLRAPDKAGQLVRWERFCPFSGLMIVDAVDSEDGRGQAITGPFQFDRVP